MSEADTDFLAPTGAPYCFDDPHDFRRSDTFAEVCECCTTAYQAEMLLARRCFPPVPHATPVRRLMDAVPDPVNVRTILAQIRVGFPSEALDETS